MEISTEEKLSMLRTVEAIEGYVPGPGEGVASQRLMFEAGRHLRRLLGGEADLAKVGRAVVRS